jgi:hypothetical protein
MSRPRRSLVLAALLTGLIATAGCGAHSETSTQEAASSEGIYLHLGGLKYQVQISRYLNPADTEDSAYLKGLPSGVTLSPRDIWFGLFMRVENDGGRSATAVSNYTITDTQDNTFRPVPLDTRVNAFAYRPQPLAPGSILPSADSVAGQGVIQGSLILFKLTEDDLQNRPLTLHIAEGSQGPSTSVALDL